MSFTLAIGSRMRLAPASNATCNDSAKFSTGTMFPPRLMLPRITICCWIGFPKTPEQRGTNAARVIGALAIADRLARWPVEVRAAVVGAAAGALAWFAPGLAGG